VRRTYIEEQGMKTYLKRRLLMIAALASPFVLALSLGAATAQAALIKGRGAQRVEAFSSGVHGLALAITVTAVVLALLVVSYFGVRGSLRVPAAGDLLPLPVRRDTSVDETRKAA
jgi:hypothetical protein